MDRQTATMVTSPMNVDVVSHDTCCVIFMHFLACANYFQKYSVSMPLELDNYLHYIVEFVCIHVG